MAGGKIIKATFGARRKLEALEKLPELGDDDEEGVPGAAWDRIARLRKQP